MQRKGRKLLVAAVGVATVNYVAVACGGATIEVVEGQDASTGSSGSTSSSSGGRADAGKPYVPPTSGNLPAPTSTPTPPIPPPPPPTSGNLPAPVALPSIEPSGGTFPGPVTVKLTSTTPNAVIFFTTDGTNPTVTSTRYEGPITLTTTTTIIAIAVYPGLGNSSTTVATFTIGDAGP